MIWPALVYEFEWTRVIGPRPTDSYFMPKGVVRGKGGAKCREDYFDSHKQVCGRFHSVLPQRASRSRETSIFLKLRHRNTVNSAISFVVRPSAGVLKATYSSLWVSKVKVHEFEEMSLRSGSPLVPNSV